MNPSSSDEIDLQELAVNIFRYFTRHKRFLFLSSILGLVIGIGFYFLLPPKYESEMIVQSDILTESYSERLTENLDRLIEEKNDSLLGVRLKLTREEAEDIKSIEIKSVKKNTTGSKEKEETIFIITADVIDKNILSRLQDGLLNYLRNNEFVKIRVKQREQTYLLMIDKVGQEIKSLDSLKKRLFQGKPIYSSTSEMMLVDPTNIYSKIIELSKQQIDYKNALELHNSIQLIEGFTAFKKPKSPKLSVALVSGLAAGFFGGILLLTITGFLKLARQKSQQDNP